MSDFLKKFSKDQKAKGLQKLRFFCQMCQKQCRDDNGFRAHQKSEGHLRMMTIFAENPDKFMDSFSQDFEKGYLGLLSRQFGSRQVNANQVYNEFIHDRDHVHMNSTIWPTLSDFVKYLGRTGKCKIEETERGWMIQYINRDPDLIAKKEKAAAREQAEMEERARVEAELEERIRIARALVAQEDDGEGGAGVDHASSSSASAKHELRRADGDDAIKVKVALAAPATAGAGSSLSSAAGAGALKPRPSIFDDDDGDVRPDAPPTAAPLASSLVAQPGGVKRSRWEDSSVPLASGSAFHSQAASGAFSSGPHDANPNPAKRGRFDAPPMAPSVPAQPAALPGASNMAALIAEEMARKAKAAADAALASSRAAAVASAASAPQQKMPAGAAAGPEDDADDDPWLCLGIVVKILSKKVGGGAYYKVKGAVKSVVADNPFVGVISISDPASGGHGEVLLKLDQADLETTIPAIGERVMFVRGRYKGWVGVLRELRVDKYQATVELARPPPSSHGGGSIAGSSGRVVDRVEYEDICRLA